MRSKTVAVALVSLLAFVLVSCANTKDTGFPPPTPSGTGNECGDVGSTEPVELQCPIDVGDSFFAPVQAQVAAGATIGWAVTGSAPHSITFDDGTFDQPEGCGKSIDKCTPNGGSEFEHVIKKPGKYHYYCKIHGRKGSDEGMYGYIIVT